MNKYSGHLMGCNDLIYPENRSDTIISVSTDRSVRFWSRKYIWEEIDKSIYGYYDAVRCIEKAVIRYKQIAVGSYDNTVGVWDYHTGKSIITHNGHNNWVWGIDFMVFKGNKSIVSCSFDNTIIIRNAYTGEIYETFSEHSDKVNSVKCYDDEWLLSASDDKQVILRNVVSGKKIIITSKDSEVSHLEHARYAVFSPDKNYIYSGGTNSNRKNKQENNQTFMFKHSKDGKFIKKFTYFSGWFRFIDCIDVNGKTFILTAGLKNPSGNCAALWLDDDSKHEQSQPLAELIGHSDIITAAVFMNIENHSNYSVTSEKRP